MDLLPRLGVAREHHAPARLEVEPLYRPALARLGRGLRALGVTRDDRVREGAALVRGERVDRDAGGLVHDEQARVHGEDPQRRVGLGRRRSGGRLDFELDERARQGRIARAHAAAADPHVAEPERALHRGAAEAERVREDAVEPTLGGQR